MAISVITALEIFTNPGDLEIIVKQERGGARFAIIILRGPAHNFKPMLTAELFVQDLDDAVRAIGEILESICFCMTKHFADNKSFLSQYINPDSLEIDQSKVLNHQLIARILDELRQNRVASTHKMFVSAC